MTEKECVIVDVTNKDRNKLLKYKKGETPGLMIAVHKLYLFQCNKRPPVTALISVTATKRNYRFHYIPSKFSSEFGRTLHNSTWDQVSAIKEICWNFRANIKALTALRN